MQIQDLLHSHTPRTYPQKNSQQKKRLRLDFRMFRGIGHVCFVCSLGSTTSIPGRKAKPGYVKDPLELLENLGQNVPHTHHWDRDLHLAGLMCVFVMEIYKRTMSQQFPVGDSVPFNGPMGGFPFPFPSKRRNPSKRNPGTWQIPGLVSRCSFPIEAPQQTTPQKKHWFSDRFFGLKKM